jgi:multiple sugar transport system substrate-binding protein
MPCYFSCRYFNYILFLLMLFGLLFFSPGCGRDKDKQVNVEKPVIRFWVSDVWKKETVDVLKSYSFKFGAEHNSRVVIQQYKKIEMEEECKSAIKSGNPPEIVQIDTGTIQKFSRDGLLSAVDPVIKSLGKDRFFPEIFNSAIKINGQYMALPWFTEVSSLLLRDDWMKELELEDPVTWQDWLSICKLMTRDLDGDGKKDRWGFGMYSGNDAGRMWVAMAAQNGGGLFNESGTPKINDEKNAEALEWLCDFKSKYNLTPPGSEFASYDEALKNYKNGIVGTMIVNSSILKYLEKEAPDILKKSRFVKIPVKSNIGKSVSYLGGGRICILKGAPNTEIAVKFLEFIFAEERYIGFLKTTKGEALPVFMDICEHDYFQDDPNKRILVEQIKGSVSYNFRGDINHSFSKLEQITTTAFKQVITGKKNAREALDEAQKEVEKILKENL